MISAIVLTKNEEGEIGDCLKTLSFCDEIIVLDDNSSDKTVDIAKKLGAKVVVRSLISFSEQRNFALQQAKEEWVLFVDADERISQELGEEIVSSVLSPGNNKGYYIRRNLYFMGKLLTHGELGGTKLLRLAKRGTGKWVRDVHEKWVINGGTGQLKNPLIHKSPKTLREFIGSLDDWSSRHALAKQKEGQKSNALKIVIWPAAHFIKNYIFRLGFLDGTHGFVFAALMSFHSYLGWSKLWVLQNKQLKH